jgi:glycosyltransferase involved in cell wall biosynthesis
MSSTQARIAVLHYSAPPVVGGVEAVIDAHAKLLVDAGYQVTVIAGRGDLAALPGEVNFRSIPEIDSQHPGILQVSRELERGIVPLGFDQLAEHITALLEPALHQFDHLIVHNVFTKHFNLPLTAALYRLIESGAVAHTIAWCHDFTWTSPNSGDRVHPGYPWDLLRTYHPDVDYVVVSKERQRILAGLFKCPQNRIRVIYNGVDPETLLGLSPRGIEIIERLDLLGSDLTIILPVRITQAKNIELALQVTAILKDRGLNAKLVVTGPPDPHDKKSMDLLHSLQTTRRQLGMENYAHFVYESGPDPSQPLMIDAAVVGDLFRVSDLLLMPSHREGFGMPVLEAGLAGIPVFCTDFPAAVEIGAGDLTLFDTSDEPPQIADQILTWMETNPVHRLRRRVRQKYTWEAIFEREIQPLLEAQRSK